MQQWWFIDIQYYQYFHNMFRVPLHPSSGGQIVLRVAANGVCSGCSCYGSGEEGGETTVLCVMTPYSLAQAYK
jgi:hypothetical protein